MINPIDKLINFLVNQIRDGFFHTKLLNARDISDPIVKAINEKEHDVLNPDDVSSPIVGELKRVHNAITTREVVKEVTIKNIESARTDMSGVLEGLKKLLNKKESKVPEINLKPVLKALQKIEDRIPEYKEQEIIDYTLMLDEMCKIMETKHYTKELSGILGALESFQESLKNFELPQLPLNEKGEVKVEKARIFFDGKVQNERGAYINPLTEETGKEINENIKNVQTAIENQSTVPLIQDLYAALPGFQFIIQGPKIIGTYPPQKASQTQALFDEYIARGIPETSLLWSVVGEVDESVTDFTIASASSASSAENLSLELAGGELDVQEATAQSSAENITLFDDTTFEIQDAGSASSADNVALEVGGGTFAIADSNSTSSSDNITIEEQASATVIDEQFTSGLGSFTSLSGTPANDGTGKLRLACGSTDKVHISNSTSPSISNFSRTFTLTSAVRLLVEFGDAGDSGVNFFFGDSADQTDGYACYISSWYDGFESGGWRVYIYRVTNGSYTSLGSADLSNDYYAAFVPISLTVNSAGSIVFKENNVTRLTVSDSTYNGTFNKIIVQEQHSGSSFNLHNYVDYVTVING